METGLSIFNGPTDNDRQAAPDLHRIHHSSYQPETDTNYGAVFPVWDIIFGTFKTKTRQPQDQMELGLEEVRDERTNNVIWLLISPFKKLNKQDK